MAATVVPSCPVPHNSPIYKLHEQAMATLNTAEIFDAIKCPLGINENMWIASQVLGIYEEVAMVVTVFKDFCSPHTDLCCVMHAGTAQYRWSDGTSLPQDLPAITYMEKVAQYGYDTLKARNLFLHDNSELPPGFRREMQQLMKKFSRVYSHIYTCHWDAITANDLEAHINCCFKRFLFVANEFDLVSMQDMQPIAGMASRFLQQAKARALANGKSKEYKEYY